MTTASRCNDVAMELLSQDEMRSATGGGGLFDAAKSTIVSLLIQLIPKGLDYFYHDGITEAKAYRRSL